MSEEPLSREERLRRVALLCAHFARNMAYYRAARDGPDRITPMSDFWTTVDGNFIDTAVLEWCKVFADRNEHQNWRKVVGAENHDDFEAGLLAALGMDAAALDAEISAARVYRDKFLAHLDSKRTMDIPHLNPMWAAVRFCFRHMLETEMTWDEAARFPVADIDAYYQGCFDAARAIYQR